MTPMWYPPQACSLILLEFIGLGAFHLANGHLAAQTNATIGRLEPFKTVNLAVKK